ncbi:universal stress protein [Ideonella sp. A 288]|uniref:universal stress protein n=1 Tax=Ideonella sp. A 288 TaxID=1962181 RepID=UPI001F303239|nr:universal stress protein [Ideonella sp. A 288]
MRSVLVAVDGSEASQKAVQHVLALRQELRDPSALVLHLLNVQLPVSGDVSAFIASKSIQEYHQERADEALAPAKALVESSGIAHQVHQRVGSPGQTIAEVAQAQGCDLIVMGTRGLGSSTAALLGSVAQIAIEHAGVPVTLVK